MAIFLQKKNNPSNWLISWARKKAHAVSRERKRKDKALLTRFYTLQGRGRVWIRSLRNATYVQIRGTGAVAITTPLRIRTNPRQGFFPFNVIIQKLTFSAEGNPINAVGASAIATGLTMQAIFYAAVSPEKGVANDLSTWNTLADQGLSNALMHFARQSVPGLLNGVILNVPPAFQSALEAGDVIVMDIVPLHYEVATKRLTFVSASTALDRQTVSFTVSINDMLPDTKVVSSSSFFFNDVQTNKLGGSNLTTTFAGLTVDLGTLPSVDGDYTIDQETDVIIPNSSGKILRVKTTTTFTLLNGVAATVTIRDGSGLTILYVTGSIIGNIDLTSATVQVNDLRAIVESATPVTPTDNIPSISDEAPIVSRYHGSNTQTSSGQTTVELSEGGELLGGPVLDTSIYLFSDDLAVPRAEIGTDPGAPARVISSPYEFIRNATVAEGTGVHFTVGLFEGLIVTHFTQTEASALYESSTLASSDPGASYNVATYEIIMRRITWTNGVPTVSNIPFTAGGSAIGIDFNPANATATGTTMDFLTVPYRKSTVSLGTGAPIAKPSVPDTSMHTLFRTMKEASVLVTNNPALDLLYDVTSGFSAILDTVNPNVWHLVDSLGNVVTTDHGLGIGDFRNLVPDLAGLSPIGFDATRRTQTTTAGASVLQNISSWNNNEILGSGEGKNLLLQGVGSELRDSFISVSDGGFPQQMVINILWVDAVEENTGLFMADFTTDLATYRIARNAWIAAKLAEATEAVLLPLAAAAIAELDIHFNNFASDEFIIAVINNPSIDVIIVT